MDQTMVDAAWIKFQVALNNQEALLRDILTGIRWHPISG